MSTVKPDDKSLEELSKLRVVCVLRGHHIKSSLKDTFHERYYCVECESILPV